ncbi:hypothetical protein VTN31DRAFT_2723 [Thermomyces dupontii]|uniref:uncharacterized protein n=1 Tax=Talaromyces thermophilus TaxID=28565 RepID=UPI00374208F3
MSLKDAAQVVDFRPCVDNSYCYDPDEFYPVPIGDVFKERYEVIGKLGFGANSTTWFCLDHQYGRSPLRCLGKSMSGPHHPRVK